MQITEALAHLREHHRAVLATLREDGAPQMSPIAATIDDDGAVVVSTRETAMKVRSLRRSPRAWLCAFPDEWYGRWIQVEGDVEIVALPEAMEGLVAYYRTIAGEHPDWDEYRAAMVAEQRVLLRITPTRAGPDHSGWPSSASPRARSASWVWGAGGGGRPRPRRCIGAALALRDVLLDDDRAEESGLAAQGVDGHGALDPAAHRFVADTVSSWRSDPPASAARTGRRSSLHRQAAV